MSSTTPIATPAQSPCKAAVATPARVMAPPCIDAATPAAAATKSEPRASTPVERAATDDEQQRQDGGDSPAKKLRTEGSPTATMGEIDRAIEIMTEAFGQSTQ
jgi:hypothetical protein